MCPEAAQEVRVPTVELSCTEQKMVYDSLPAEGEFLVMEEHLLNTQNAWFPQPVGKMGALGLFPRGDCRETSPGHTVLSPPRLLDPILRGVGPRSLCSSRALWGSSIGPSQEMRSLWEDHSRRHGRHRPKERLFKVQT